MKNLFEYIICSVAAFASGFAFAISIGLENTDKAILNIQKQAIERNYGEWTTNTNKKVIFEWK